MRIVCEVQDLNHHKLNSWEERSSRFSKHKSFKFYCIICKTFLKKGSTQLYLIKIVGPNSNGPCHDLNDRDSVSIVLTLTLTIRAAPGITVHLRRRGRDGGTRLEQREWLVCSESRSLGRRGRQDLGQSRFSSVFWVSVL